MKISVLGTGVVGQTIAGKLNELNHDVFMGTRNAEKTNTNTQVNQMSGASFADWHKNNTGIQVLNFEDIPSNTDLFVNATSGYGSIHALQAVGKEKLKGKTVLDISNPLDFSQGFPPSLFVSNTDSLGEQIQKEFPESNIVKGLSTMNAFLMVNPSSLTEDHTVIISGNNENAKNEVSNLLISFGWKASNIIDLGDITTARGTEMYLALWVRLYGALGTGNFNIKIVKD